MELGFHEKLECEEFEFQNSGRLLYSFKTVVAHYIFWPTMIFGHFGQSPSVTLGKVEFTRTIFLRPCLHEL